MKTGTNHFVSIPSAVKCYGIQGESRAEVLNKIKNEEIVIGAPVVKKGNKLSVDSSGRYWIEDGKK